MTDLAIYMQISLLNVKISYIDVFKWFLTGPTVFWCTCIVKKLITAHFTSTFKDCFSIFIRGIWVAGQPTIILVTKAALYFSKSLRNHIKGIMNLTFQSAAYCFTREINQNTFFRKKSLIVHFLSVFILKCPSLPHIFHVLFYLCMWIIATITALGKFLSVYFIIFFIFSYVKICRLRHFIVSLFVTFGLKFSSLWRNFQLFIDGATSLSAGTNSLFVRKKKDNFKNYNSGLDLLFKVFFIFSFSV